MMQEDIGASVVRNYKPETFFGIKPFDNAADDRQRFNRVPLTL